GVSRVYRTDNAGKDWQLLTNKLMGSFLHSGSLSFPTLQTGYYASRYGGVGHAGVTVDGGKTWQDQITDDKIDKDMKNGDGGVALVQFVDVKTGWFIPFSGTIHATRDGGKTWTPQKLGDGAGGLTDMHFANAKLG